MSTVKTIWKKVYKVLIVLFVVFVLIFPAVFTNSVFGYLPIFVVSLTFLTSLIYLLIMKRSISISTEGGADGTAVRGSTMNVKLRVKNNSFLVCSKAKADVFIQDYLGSNDSTTETIFSIDRNSDAEFGFDIKLDHVGIYTAGIKNMHVFGLLGLFTINIPFETVFTVTVLPKEHEEETELNAEMLTDSADAASFSENDGFDYTGVREYVQGDSMKKIHWNLSAHSMGYMTKINEMGKKSDMSVVIDPVADKYDNDDLLGINDCLVETAISLMKSAERQDIDRRLIYVDKKMQAKSMLPKSRYDYIELLKKMYIITCNPPEYLPDSARILEEESSYANRSANIIVLTSKITESLLNEVTSCQANMQNVIVYYVVPPSAAADDIKHARGALRGLDSSGVSYEIIKRKDN